MTELNAIEQRLAKIETELETIKRRLERPAKGNWISRMRGQFKDDPIFDEILRLGKEIRDAELPPDDATEKV